MSILPFLLTSCQQDTIAISAGLVGGISSLITLIIAFLLFDKYGLKKDFIKSQTEIVLAQLEVIKTVRFLIRSKDKFLQFFPTINRVDSYEIFYSEKLVFSKKYWEYVNQIFKYSSSIYMPQSIVTKINRLMPSVIANMTEGDIESYSKVTFWGDHDEDMVYGKFNHEDVTFHEFYTNWLDIIDEIRNWLKDKIDIDKLNIDS